MDIQYTEFCSSVRLTQVPPTVTHEIQVRVAYAVNVPMKKEQVLETFHLDVRLQLYITVTVSLS